VTVLDIRDLSVSYRAPGRPVAAVRGVSIGVADGEIVGLAGESGCGKTTVARAVLRLLPPAATVTGRVLLDGRDVLTLGWGDLRAVRWTGASIVFQGAQHSLNPVHRVGAQIAEPLLVHRRATRRAAAATAADLLARVGLPADLGDRFPHQLSGGQRQRVMIAMALACSPRVMIADEATSAVDTVTRSRLLRLLTDLVAERGLGLLMISHDLPMLASTCSRLMVMYAGRVVEDGPAGPLVRAPRHPYTAGLVRAAGRLGDPAARRRPRSLPGDPPDPAQPQPGCAFAPRCARALPACVGSPVRLRPDGPARRVACVSPVDGVAAASEGPPGGRPAGRAVGGPSAALLSVRELSVGPPARSSGSAPIVDRVSLHVGPAEIVGLVGESGGGKTTLARATVGLCRPVAGEISLGGAVLAHTGAALRRFRRQVQFIPQDPGGALNPGHTVGRAVTEALRIHRVDPADAPRRVAEALARVGLRPPERFLPRYPAELSGGQQARVAIAAGLVVGPRVLIADEPVAALDASARGEILDLLLRLRDGTGLSVLLVTHDLAAAWQVADRLVVMRAGRMVETGAVERVVSAPTHPYTRMLLDAGGARGDNPARDGAPLP
jgi:oligopeptide/dipeptide ABC transporter ATP-binding protein